MSRKIGNAVFLEVTPNDDCELCGKHDELRPYGPNGERVCFECGMKNPEAAAQKFSEFVFGKTQ